MPQLRPKIKPYHSKLKVKIMKVVTSIAWTKNI